MTNNPQCRLDNSVPYAHLALALHLGASVALSSNFTQQVLFAKLGQDSAFSEETRRFDYSIQMLQRDIDQIRESLIELELSSDVIIDDSYVERASAMARHAQPFHITETERKAYRRLDDVVYTLDIDYDEA